MTEVYDLSDHPSWKPSEEFYRMVQQENAERYRNELLNKSKAGVEPVSWLTGMHISRVREKDVKGFQIGQRFFVGKYTDEYVETGGLFYLGKDFKTSKRLGYYKDNKGAKRFGYFSARQP